MVRIKMECPINLTQGEDCEHCKYGKLNNEDYEYRCNYKNG